MRKEKGHGLPFDHVVFNDTSLALLSSKGDRFRLK